jgi:TATA-box binding protein (TBP) (component of TFIID and TFIIIB)
MHARDENNLNYTVRNIKLSIFITNITTLELRERIRNLWERVRAETTHKSNNFFVYKAPVSRCVYTLFFTGHINLTKVESESDIRNSVRELTRLLQLNPDAVSSSRTDNITVSGSFSELENCYSLFQRIVLTPRPDIFRKQSFNNTVFPNAFLSPHIGGTIILSKKLNYSLVGCKSVEAVERTITLLSHLLRERYVSTSG